MTEPFIGIADLEAATGEDDLTTDPLAVIVLDAACEVVRGYIDNHVNLIEETIVLDGNGRGRLVLPQPPVREIVSIVIDDTTLDTADYVLEAAGIIRRVDDVWDRGFGNITITYVHGWDIEEPDDPEYTPDDFERVPSDLRSVALGLARRKFEAVSAGSASGAVIEESIGGGDYRYKLSEGAIAASTSQTLLDDEESVLDRYRAPVNR